MVYFGIDSSNYRSSAAAIKSDNTFISSRKLLEVEKGKCGLRQSDAVFLHTKQLPLIVNEVLEGVRDKKIAAISVSSKPRNIDGSYMPCFLSGVSIAKTLATALNVPLFEFSHQEGHIAAALLSANRLDLLDKRFIAFHLSGGTTEALLVSPDGLGGFNCEIIGKTLDISVGQVIDRVGVMLGLSFPSGVELEKLALNGTSIKPIKLCLKGNDLALSGVQNICERLFKEGNSSEDIAATALQYVTQSVLQMALKFSKEYSDLEFVFSGGVVANEYFKAEIFKFLPANFASVELSGDNAVGIALLGKLKMEK